MWLYLATTVKRFISLLKHPLLNGKENICNATALRKCDSKLMTSHAHDLFLWFDDRFPWCAGWPITRSCLIVFLEWYIIFVSVDVMWWLIRSSIKHFIYFNKSWMECNVRLWSDPSLLRETNIDHECVLCGIYYIPLKFLEDFWPCSRTAVCISEVLWPLACHWVMKL